MGGCVSVQLSCDQVVNNVSHCLCENVNYILNLEDNLMALETTTQELKARRDDLLTRIKTEEDRGLRRLEEVQLWLSRVQTIENQVNDLLDVRATEIQRLCVCGYCSKNLVSSFRYDEKVLKMCKEVHDLKSKGVFEAVTTNAPMSKVEKRPIQPIVGREDLLERTWTCLMEDGVGILGLYGMGGVGKTTLLTLINNKFIKTEDDFDIVIWVMVSKYIQIQNIQEHIGEKLGLNSDDWKQKGQMQKASDLHNILLRKRFVLLFDDIWSKVSFIEIGIPYPDRENRCKVVFTTRSKEVCGRMGFDIEMEVKCLAQDDAWNLFIKKVGEITLGTHPDIPYLASIVARKCQGLPLALNIIGETMACKRTIQEWHQAIDVLKSSAYDFFGMEDDVLSILKYSYDNLKDERIKLCFQYCALFPEDYRIGKSELVDYWIGEGILDGIGNRERAENKGYEIINTLVHACLMIERDQGFVKMHGVVREMALWVASDLAKQKEIFLVRASAKLHKIPQVQDWKVVRRVSLMDNRIREISGNPECLKLETMFLQDNKLVNLSDHDVVKELQLLEHLEVLTMDISVPSTLEEFFSDQRLASCARYLRINCLFPKSSEVSLSRMDHLRSLRIENSVISEIKIDMKFEGTETLLPRHDKISRCFLNLSLVAINDCGGMRDLTWLMFAPNLSSLEVEFSDQLEEMISKEKAADVTNGHCGVIPFCKLQVLGLFHLPKLMSIFSDPLPFPCLRKIMVSECPKLRKLPLGSKSVPGAVLNIFGEKKWFERLVWDNEAAKDRFLPSCYKLFW